MKKAVAFFDDQNRFPAVERAFGYAIPICDPSAARGDDQRRKGMDADRRSFLDGRAGRAGQRELLPALAAEDAESEVSGMCRSGWR